MSSGQHQDFVGGDGSVRCIGTPDAQGSDRRQARCGLYAFTHPRKHRMRPCASPWFSLMSLPGVWAMVPGRRAKKHASVADYARTSLRRKKRELIRALEGTFTENQRWLLDQELR